MVYAFNISNLDYLIYQNSKFEISKVFDIGWQIYKDKKIKVFGKDSIPFFLYLYLYTHLYFEKYLEPGVQIFDNKKMVA